MTSTDYQGFTDEERAAMKSRAAELKAAAERGSGAGKAAADLSDCLDALAAQNDDDRVIGETLHAVVTEHAPDLAAQTMYGMPAYAGSDGNVVVYFKPGGQYGMRYSEIGFQDSANLDDGDIWPSVFAVTRMTPAVEKKLIALVKQAVS